MHTSDKLLKGWKKRCCATVESARGNSIPVASTADLARSQFPICRDSPDHAFDCNASSTMCLESSTVKPRCVSLRYVISEPRRTHSSSLCEEPV